MAIALDDVPLVDLDPYADDFIADPHHAYDAMRRAGPVFRLARYGCYGAARYNEVRAALEDWSNFSSAAGVSLANFLTEKPWRPPSLLLESDPPLHDRMRDIVDRVVTPKALRPLREPFRRAAEATVERVLARRTIDGVRDLAEAYPLQVFPDAVGLDAGGREHLLPYGEMVFNGFGPYNARFESSLANAKAVVPWITGKCQRAALAPDSLGAQLYQAVDAGEVTDDQAAMLVRSFLSAGLDTTVAGLASTLLLLAENPDQWRKLRTDPALARNAFEETLRLESPLQNLFRTTAREVAFGGARLAANQKILLFLGSANRDPERWPEPTRYDITRDLQGHLAFGVGLHACVGQVIARLEAESLLGALARRVATIELAGPPTRKPNNAVRMLASLPLAITPA
jgi:cytochrome P450